MEAPKQDFHMTMARVDDDEKLLAIIKHHPFGIIRVYFLTLVGFGAAGALIMLVLPEMVSRDDNPDIYSLLALISVLVIGLMALLLFIATIIYYRSKLVVTDKTITQTIQNGLFSQKISQLAVSSIEDVTASKSGFFPTVFNYGKLLVETAGEQENFHFDYCSQADHYAKLILETRQQYLTGREFEFSAQKQQYQQYPNPMPYNSPAQQPQNPGFQDIPNQQAQETVANIPQDPTKPPTI